MTNLAKTQEMKNRTVSAALLMAAGMGTRIRPLSEETPKPLIRVCGVPMIESIINGLHLAGIHEIYITVGYRKEKYYYLAEKYEGITFIENKEFERKNTISSFYAAMEHLKNKNCFVSESDLFVKDPHIFKNKIDISRYYIRDVKNQDYEWGFNLSAEDKILRIVRPQKGVYLNHHMYGMAYWTKEDINMLIAATKEAYKSPGHENWAYDEVANNLYTQLNVGVIRLHDGQLYEIDSIDDLVKVDTSYANYL